MDYFMVALAWELDLRDLKKLSLNGLTYSSIGEVQKKHLKENVFPTKWKDFIYYLNHEI